MDRAVVKTVIKNEQKLIGLGCIRLDINILMVVVYCYLEIELFGNNSNFRKSIGITSLL